MTQHYIQYTQRMQGRFLEGRAAVVTGSSKGIGRAIAIALAQAGAAVTVCCNTGLLQAEETCTAIRDSGGECILFQGDLADSAQAARLVQVTVAAFGMLDILVNNAGITDARHFSQLSEADWDRMERANSKSMFNCCHHAIDFIANSDMGRILNITSMCGKSGGIGAGAHYCATKGGMIGFTKALAHQYADRGVTVNAIAPAMIDTEMIRWRTPQQMQETVQAIPLGRIGKTEEVAGPAVFLCSPFASFITGYTMDVNGGMYMD